jgi:hypothetical protein
MEKSDPNTFVKLVHDAMKTSKKNSEKEDVREFAYNFAMSLLLGLSFSVAVLQNLYQHFKRFFEEEQGESNLGRKREGLLLIQAQLVKMYDLRRSCLLIKQVFEMWSSNSLDITKKRSTKKKRGSQTVSASVIFLSSIIYLFSDKKNVDFTENTDKGNERCSTT